MNWLLTLAMICIKCLSPISIQKSVLDLVNFIKTMGIKYYSISFLFSKWWFHSSMNHYYIVSPSSPLELRVLLLDLFLVLTLSWRILLVFLCYAKEMILLYVRNIYVIIYISYTSYLLNENFIYYLPNVCIIKLNCYLLWIGYNLFTDLSQSDQGFDP